MLGKFEKKLNYSHADLKSNVLLLLFKINSVVPIYLFAHKRNTSHTHIAYLL